MISTEEAIRFIKAVDATLKRAATPMISAKEMKHIEHILYHQFQNKLEESLLVKTKKSYPEDPDFTLDTDDQFKTELNEVEKSVVVHTVLKYFRFIGVHVTTKYYKPGYWFHFYNIEKIKDTIEHLKKQYGITETNTNSVGIYR